MTSMIAELDTEQPHEYLPARSAPEDFGHETLGEAESHALVTIFTPVRNLSRTVRTFGRILSGKVVAK